VPAGWLAVASCYDVSRVEPPQPRREKAVPTVSIIVPVYNVAPYLEECLQSIARQSFGDFECIVVDDGSTDGSGEMCDSWAACDPRFRVLHQENRGLSAARNTGLDVASGEYVQFVDSDDWVEPNYTEALLRYAKRSGCPCVICGYAKQTPHGWVNSRPSTHPTVVSARDCLKLFLQPPRRSTCRIPATAWSRMYRRSLFEDNGIRFPIGRNYEDYCVLFPTIYYSESVSLVPDILYHYRRRENSITSARAPQVSLDRLEACLLLERSVVRHYLELLPSARSHSEQARILCWLHLSNLSDDTESKKLHAPLELGDETAPDALRKRLRHAALSHPLDPHLPGDGLFAMALLLIAIAPGAASMAYRNRRVLLRRYK